MSTTRAELTPRQIKSLFDLLAAKCKAGLVTREEWQAEMKRLHALKPVRSELAHSESEPLLVNVTKPAERVGHFRI